MKRHAFLLAAAVVLAFGSVAQAQTNYYFDMNDDVAGSGVSNSAYDWTADGSGLLPGLWNTNNADGTQAAPGLNVTWTNGNNAIFSAGTDAAGQTYGVKIATGITANSAKIEEGTLQISSGILDTGANVTEVASGATVEIASSLRFNSGGTLKLSDGTLHQLNPGGAGSLISGAKNLEINGSGTVEYGLSTGCNCTIYTPDASHTILGTGGTAGTGGAGTLIKTGPGEFRYQGPGIPNSSFAKLVVKNGLFRLGSNSSIADERGFGAVPLAPLADAITLDGGAIGTSFGATINVNRGITITANNGWFNNAGSTMAVASVVSGVGSLNKDIDPNLIKGSATASGRLNLTSATGNTYQGGTNLNAGTIWVNNTSGSGTGSGPVVVAGSSATQFGTLMGIGSISGLTTLNAFGELRPGGTVSVDTAGTITLNGGLTLNSGSLLSYQMGPTGNDKAVIAGVNGLNIAGPMNMTILANGVITSAGQFPVLDYDTSFLGSLSDITLNTSALAAGFTYSLVDNVATTSIDFKITSAVVGVPGDFNNDGFVTALDYVTWRKNDIANAALPNDNGVGNQAARYTLWKSNFVGTPGSGSGLGSGAVPEPTSVCLLLSGLGFLAIGRRRSR